MSRIPNLGVLERAYPAGPAEPVPSIAGSNLGRTQQDSHPPGALPIGRLAVGGRRLASSRAYRCPT